jgi:hypothetical protein
MSITLPLDKMTVEEKIQAMETIWDDLCERANNLSSPAWHAEILNEREAAIERGEDEFIDWENARQNIKIDYLVDREPCFQGSTRRTAARI